MVAVATCLYTESRGQVYILAQISTWIVPLYITALSFVKDQRTGRKGVQFCVAVFAWVLTLAQFALYAIQASVRVIRPDPFCPEIPTYGLPSTTAFYTAVGGTLIFVMIWLTAFDLSITLSLILVGCWIVIPTVLMWFAFNTWQEVAISYGLGILVTLPYFWLLRTYLLDMLPYILNMAPFTWMGCLDTLIQSEAGQMHTETIRQWKETVDGYL